MKATDVSLGEICDFIRGITFPAGEAQPEPFPESIACLTTSGVQAEVAWHSRRYVPNSRVVNHERFLRPGDILISTANSKELVGKSCLVRSVPFPCTFGAFVTTARPNKHVLPVFLAHWMTATAFQNWCFRYSSNTTNISNLRVSELEELRFKLPALAEQKRIAAILERADRLRRLRRYGLEMAESFLPAAFLRLFGDPRQSSTRWEMIQLADLGRLDRGRSRHRPRNAPHLYGGKYPFVQTGDVANSGGYIRGHTQTYSEEGLKQSKIWPAGTLCITIAANIAKTGILTFESCFPDSIVGFIAGDSVRIEFVQFWLGFLQEVLERTAPEVAQKNINLEILSDLQCPVPPMLLQNELADLVHRYEAVRKIHRESLRQAEHLFQALLQRAFTSGI